MGALLYLSFVAVLWPGELLALTAADVLLPSALISSRPRAHVRIKLPKTRRLAARRQHDRFDEPVLIELLEAWLLGILGQQQLRARSAYQFRQAHDALVSHLGVPASNGGHACQPWRRHFFL
ncbi:unnamed protein product [Prorocentrum cordatum]|uniref:Secreted protein n=1 Tax=Prorocentrum cordatum TaxID=2364126 RepID=A0ABN9WLK7_9DINO|nr:unnamed protein product [Polarella glacialis]